MPLVQPHQFAKLSWRSLKITSIRNHSSGPSEAADWNDSTIFFLEPLSLAPFAGTSNTGGGRLVESVGAGAIVGTGGGITTRLVAVGVGVSVGLGSGAVAVGIVAGFRVSVGVAVGAEVAVTKRVIARVSSAVQVGVGVLLGASATTQADEFTAV